MVRSISTVGVVGTGVIGASWTALFLARGLRVLVSDPAPGAKDGLMAYLKESWPILERLGLHQDASISNCTFVGESLDNYCDEVDFIQENVPEKVELKRKLLATLDRKTSSDVIIASSSSGIPASQFVVDCPNPERILIGHPFNPPHLMPLVEVVPHPQTEQSISEAAMSFYRDMGKSPVLIRQETPGFVANRLQAALANEAYSLVQRGIISAEDCDTCVTTGVGLRWALTGPFMTNVLGGGGGEEGFQHLLTHLAPAVVTWTQDMDSHKFCFTDENIQKLNSSVEQFLARSDLKALESQRDEALIDMVARKKDAPALK